ELCFAAIVELKRQGMAVLLVEQNTHRALAAADRVYVLASGRIVYEASGEQARRDPSLVDSFLGMAEADDA
ncbi:MAG TPA: ABC transporter ATP-binding protein, partial [Zeimonas sp.]